jgi:6-phosphogluconolactonase
VSRLSPTGINRWLPLGMKFDASDKVEWYLFGDNTFVVENVNDEAVDVSLESLHVRQHHGVGLVRADWQRHSKPVGRQCCFIGGLFPGSSQEINTQITVKNPLRHMLVLSSICCLAVAISTAKAVELSVLIGDHSSGPGKGFTIAHFDTTTGVLTKPQLLIEASAPAFFVVTKDDRKLYTCNSPGFVSAYKVDPTKGELTFLNKLPTGGGDPSYISLDQTEKYAFVANYEGGSIAAWSLKPDGSLNERTAFIQHTGHGINPQRQSHAFAHSIIVDPSNNFVLAADLGLDKLFVYKFDAANGTLTPNDPAYVSVTPGAGPRHVIFHPNGRWVYLVTEMGSTVYLYNWDGQKGVLTESQSVSTLPADFHGVSTSAEIMVSRDGKFLYTSNRGHDSIAVFSIDQANGRLTPIQHIPTSGRTPRNFDIDPSGRWLLVTNQDSKNASVFRVDPQTGLLTMVGKPMAVPFTFCLRFLTPQP